LIIVAFNRPHILALPLGVTPLEFRPDLWRQKTRSPWAIVWRCLRDPIHSAVRYNTGVWQTDRDTRRQHIPR